MSDKLRLLRAPDLAKALAVRFDKKPPTPRTVRRRMNEGIDGVVMESAWDGPRQYSCLQWYDDWRKRLADKKIAKRERLRAKLKQAMRNVERRLALR